jgi:hypothetical protein
MNHLGEMEGDWESEAVRQAKVGGVKVSWTAHMDECQMTRGRNTDLQTMRS